MRFRTTVELGGKTATGFRVPRDVVTGLGRTKRPPVTVTINGHTYRSTVAAYGDDYYLPLSAENRTAAGVGAGDEIEVDVELDTEPRAVEVPADLAAALAAAPAARAAFEALSYSHKRRHVLAIDDAKTQPTRERRIAKTITDLSG
ncbi:hypothetical protein [Alloactinosynnema sp. L-07]|uniref:DUF1905 domain-containing protein n=1 Tax=Alloactinosynnema sp. L-07 TaxID=1653480 RepID=UPI00065EFB5F|nr:YdeI/OmpD-associated family protein [Alloactinosynnema sp. L-07]CRK56256.1 hypothetical protein [Alloactinosynnema sp. L-07]